MTSSTELVAAQSQCDQGLQDNYERQHEGEKQAWTRALTLIDDVASMETQGLAVVGAQVNEVRSAAFTIDERVGEQTKRRVR